MVSGEKISCWCQHPPLRVNYFAEMVDVLSTVPETQFSHTVCTIVSVFTKGKNKTAPCPLGVCVSWIPFSQAQGSDNLGWRKRGAQRSFRKTFKSDAPAAPEGPAGAPRPRRPPGHKSGAALGGPRGCCGTGVRGRGRAA